MRVLLTNDDGIHAEGLAALERIAATFSDDVWVVAPETDQSGFAHSLSLSEPLRLRRVGEKRFALRGTPTDCVIMGVRHLLPEPPDLVMSGVNSGANVADDVSYSGTVAGAIEGTMLAIRSIALSQAYSYDDQARVVPYATAEALAPPLLAKLLAAPREPGVLLNVNFPNCAPSAVVGTLVTSQGRLAHGLQVDERRDGRGLPYFWLRFSREPEDHAEDSDLHALANGFVSVTPLQLDMTAHAAKARLSRTLAEMPA